MSGVKPVEAKEILYQAVPYCGIAGQPNIRKRCLSSRVASRWREGIEIDPLLRHLPKYFRNERPFSLVRFQGLPPGLCELAEDAPGQHQEFQAPCGQEGHRLVSPAPVPSLTIVRHDIEGGVAIVPVPAGPAHQVVE